jgi:outer membrane protein TolC
MKLLINIYIVLAFLLGLTYKALAQKDDYVQEQLELMVIKDSLNLSDPLEKYIKIAAENNPNLKSLFNSYLAALERLPQAKGLPDPEVMFGYFIKSVETRVGPAQFGFAINQAFPWFGQLKAKEQAAANIAQSRFEAFEDERNKLYFNVRSTYYNLYVLESAIRIMLENIELLESYKQLANVKLESNKGSAVDLLRVEMDLAELHNELELLRDTRIPIQSEFYELLNIKGFGEIVIPELLITKVIKDDKLTVFDSMLLNNPGLKKIDSEIKALINEALVAKKMGNPSFNIGLAYTNISKRTDVEDFSDNGKDSFVFPQIGIRIPIYRKKYKAMVIEKELLRTAKTHDRENKENSLSTDLEKIWRDYLDAQRRIFLYDHLSLLAQQSLDILTAEYTSAGTDFEEMLRMERQLLKYELKLEKARGDQNTSVAFINYLIAK